KKLHKRKIAGILIEGGGRINHSFLKAGMIDKVYSFIAPKIVGGNDGISVFTGKGVTRMKDVSRLQNVVFEEINDNILITGEFKN
ncbi:MAG: RibD family protein, partial [Halanaerobiaceae bacterium]